MRVDLSKANYQAIVGPDSGVTVKKTNYQAIRQPGLWRHHHEGQLSGYRRAQCRHHDHEGELHDRRRYARGRSSPPDVDGERVRQIGPVITIHAKATTIPPIRSTR